MEKETQDLLSTAELAGDGGTQARAMHQQFLRRAVLGALRYHTALQGTASASTEVT